MSRVLSALARGSHALDARQGVCHVCHGAESCHGYVCCSPACTPTCHVIYMVGGHSILTQQGAQTGPFQCYLCCEAGHVLLSCEAEHVLPCAQERATACRWCFAASAVQYSTMLLRRVTYHSMGCCGLTLVGPLLLDAAAQVSLLGLLVIGLIGEPTGDVDQVWGW